MGEAMCVMYRAHDTSTADPLPAADPDTLGSVSRGSARAATSTPGASAWSGIPLDERAGHNLIFGSVPTWESDVFAFLDAHLRQR